MPFDNGVLFVKISIYTVKMPFTKKVGKKHGSEFVLLHLTSFYVFVICFFFYIKAMEPTKHGAGVYYIAFSTSLMV